MHYLYHKRYWKVATEKIKIKNDGEAMKIAAAKESDMKESVLLQGKNVWFYH